MEGQGANWACQPHPGVEQTPHSVSGVQTEQPPTLQPPQCCSENEGRAPTMGCHPTPGAQLSKPIAAQIGSSPPSQVLLHGAQTAQLFLGSQEPGRTSPLNSQQGLKKKGHRALCVQFFPQNLPVRSITPLTLGHRDKPAQRPEGPGAPCTGRDISWGPQRMHTAAHTGVQY